MTSAVCDRARSWVSIDIDGGLSTFEQRMLDRHLDGCESCRAFADDTAQFTLALREAALEPARVALDLPRRRRAIVSNVMAGTGMAAAVAAAAVFAFSPGGGGSQSVNRSASRALASGSATLATNADTLGVRPTGTTPRIVGFVRGAFGLPT